MSTTDGLKELQQVYEEYVLVFGQEAQFKMVLEEALEFAHAALKADRALRKPTQHKNIIHLPYSPSHPGWTNPEFYQLLKEAVDCLIMIGQLPWISGQISDLEFLKVRHEEIVAKMKKRLEQQEAGGE